MMDHYLPRRRGMVISIAALCSTLILFYLASFGGGGPHRISGSFSFAPRDAQWLIATMSPTESVGRRMIIRQTWQRLYADPSLWTTRFVVSRASSPAWQAIIDAENATHGDIIQLSHLEENNHIANTIKTIEFFKHLSGWEASPNRSEAESMAESQPLKWKYISKIDDDSFLDARTFYRQYLVPLKSRRRTIIARTLHQPDFTVPGGQFYTLTSDMVSLLASLHIRNPISNEAEDVLVGRLLHEAKVDWKHVDLPNPVAFDYEPKELRSKQKAFADAGADLGGWSHAVGPGAINPHKMRDDNAYVEVAACFDERGVIIHAN